MLTIPDCLQYGPISAFGAVRRGQLPIKYSNVSVRASCTARLVYIEERTTDCELQRSGICRI